MLSFFLSKDKKNDNIKFRNIYENDKTKRGAETKQNSFREVGEDFYTSS